MAGQINTIEKLRGFLNRHPEHRPTVPTGPGVGLGGRMGGISSTSAMLAIEQLGIQASAIQASVFRELSPDFTGPETVYVDYKGLGKVPVGHTGMTIRGQFLESVGERIQKNITGPYCADADHIPLNGDSDKALDRFRKFVLEARDRTFFTIDPHQCIDQTQTIPAKKFKLVLPAMENAAAVISDIKRQAPYVIELSIDECPGITTVEELEYLLMNLSNKDIPLFSIAPAIGFDKKDQDSPQLRENLRALLSSFDPIVRNYEVVLGIHSGDGKSDETQRIIGAATDGKVWYKVSPDRQRLFFKLLEQATGGSSERLLFEEMFQQLLPLIEKGASSEDPEFGANCRESLKEVNSLSSDNPMAGCKMIYNFGFLVVSHFKDKIDAVSDLFRQQYYEADLQYIRGLAKNLNLI